MNVYHFIEHLAIGAALGTLSYRKAGRGIKGIGAGLLVATLYNVGWESLEPSIPNYNKESFYDTLSDIGMIYTGSILGFLVEKGKKQFIQPTAQK